MREDPWLAQSAFEPQSRVHYVLFFDTVQNSGDNLSFFLSLSTFFVLPGSDITHYSVAASLYEAHTGELIAAAEASGTRGRMFWLPAILVAPVTMFTVPSEDEIYSDLFRSTLAGIEKKTANRPLPAPVSASDLVVDQYPARAAHTIRVIHTGEDPAE